MAIKMLDGDLSVSLKNPIQYCCNSLSITDHQLIFLKARFTAISFYRF